MLQFQERTLMMHEFSSIPPPFHQGEGANGLYAAMSEADHGRIQAFQSHLPLSKNLALIRISPFDDCSAVNAHRRTWKSSESAQPDENHILHVKKKNLRVARRKQPCVIPLSHSYNLCEDKLFSFMCFISLKA